MDSPAVQMAWQELPDARQHLPRSSRVPASGTVRPAGGKPKQSAALRPWHGSCVDGFRRHEDRQMNPLWDAVMETPTYIALSRQMALQAQMDVVANNIANANTQGFKAEMMLMSEVDLPAEQGTKLAYVQDFATARDFS